MKTKINVWASHDGYVTRLRKGKLIKYPAEMRVHRPDVTDLCTVYMGGGYFYYYSHSLKLAL